MGPGTSSAAWVGQAHRVVPGPQPLSIHLTGKGALVRVRHSTHSATVTTGRLVSPSRVKRLPSRGCGRLR